jgi:hypothetical protein
MVEPLVIAFVVLAVLNNLALWTMKLRVKAHDPEGEFISWWDASYRRLLSRHSDLYPGSPFPLLAQ